MVSRRAFLISVPLLVGSTRIYFDIGAAYRARPRPTMDSSIWLVAWGETTSVGIFPKGSKVLTDPIRFDRRFGEITTSFLSLGS